MTRTPNILIFDSGLGGLTVYTEIKRARPDANYVYVADDAAFPYGRIYGPTLLARVAFVLDKMIARHRPDLVVIACNTASTLVLPTLRSTFADTPFIGTVPAVKPAAELSRSGVIAVLATPGTVQRDYTHDLVREHAAHCRVELVGSTRLASIAEAFMRGEATSDAEIAAEIAPCFINLGGEQRTDAIALACTHFPLLLAQFERLAPWPVAWIDPAPAIARRVEHILKDLGFAPADKGAASVRGRAIFTSGRQAEGSLAAVLDGRALDEDRPEALPFEN